MSQQQNAAISGNYNTTVQIVGDGNSVTISGAVPLALASYLAETFAAATAHPLQANQPGYTATGRRATAILRPYNRRSLPLQGRADILSPLRSWLDDPAPLSVSVLTGPGGRGKTRLAIELCAEARSLPARWTAGFALADRLDIFTATGCRTRWTAPTLVVIDYAAAKSTAIAAWLRALVHDPQPQKLRLLLLERFGGEGASWWRDLFAQPGAEGEAIADLLAPGAPIELGPLADPAERHAVFAAAFRAASPDPPPAPNAALDHALAQASLGGDPLFLAMFGLTAARQGLATAQSLTADRIALDLAREELARIGKIWSAHGLPVLKDRPFHAHLAAIAALCEGLDAPAALAAIEREAAELHISLPGGAEPARAALAEALPAPAGGIAPIQPDILAEAAMIEAWRPLPDRGAGTTRRAAKTHPDATTRTIVRACQDFLIRGRPEPLAWLKAARADLTSLQELRNFSDALPRATVELREVAADLSETIATLARSLPPDEGAPILATALNNLSVHLSNLGRREAALSSIEEAVSLRRTLAAARPDAFLPDLAMSLNNLSGRLCDLGRREAALSSIEEAVSLCRTLAAARPDAFLPDLAMSLNNLSNHLSDLGRREAALSAIEEAVSLRRTLAAARPDAFLPNLATSLNNLSGRLSDLGRPEAALSAIEEAVSLRRTLAAAHPDAFLPDLAMSLNNLSNRLSDVARPEAALSAIEEAVSLYCTLAAARPDAFLPDLASSLNNLSNRLSDLVRPEAALSAIEEAVSLRRTLAAARPDAFLPGLAMSCGAKGRILRDADPAAAAGSFAEGLAILRPFFLATPPAFANLMHALRQCYLDTTRQAGLHPDPDLLAPIDALLDTPTGALPRWTNT